MPRLVLVSNRVCMPGDTSSAGGLAVAIRDILRERGGLWFGWSGKISNQASYAPNITTAAGVTYATVNLSEVDHYSYYSSYSNSTLWPLFHYRLGLIAFDRNAFEGYLKVNHDLAAMLLPFIEPADVIWVHDYHLIPFGEELRRLGVTNRIGFFLHTPFPAPEVFHSLPQNDRLLQAFAAYDVIGVQTENDRAALAQCMRGYKRTDGALAASTRRQRILALPIGIDTEGFVEMAKEAEASPEVARLKQSLAGRDLIIGVDRLDYSKALPNRFEAIESLLTRWPQVHGRFTYLQIAPHSRSECKQYQNLRRELEAASGRVNGKFAECDWTPVRYVNRGAPRARLAGFYRMARVGLVTPFRDGMNLVAKEFVAAQDPQNPGALVLSKFAGAAVELKTALLINPYDIREIADALNTALEMPLPERRRRWETMMQAVSDNTIATWSNAFLSALASPRKTTAETGLKIAVSSLDPIIGRAGELTKAVAVRDFINTKNGNVVR